MAIKVGFVGTGGMAGAHMNTLKTFDDVEFVAMCDVSEDRAKSRANEFGGKAFTDFKEMFDKVDMDAVYICTPPFAHGEQEKIACGKGIAMFIEKPIAIKTETAIIINDYIQSSGVITSVGYHWRYQSNAQSALSVLKKEKKVLGALGYWMGGMPGTPWWRVKAESGGQHCEQTTHIFDLCRFLVGSDAKTVHGVSADGTMTDIPNYDIEDISMVNIQFKNGAAANISSGCVFNNWGRVHLEVFSRDLVIMIGGPGPLISRKGQAEEVEQKPGADRDRIFIDAVTTKDASKILSPYSDAVETLKITDAASKSFLTGKAVDL
jgi:myo-inositol 2-dehydrogenase / D-chiro-inositol 1-dehydrogenase